MSLNGLDDPAVLESYQAALAEAGGWFLLKYVARDAVGLLSRGTGGVAEIRISIDGYEETSPLYGFLQYRRRKIILKYIPEGISRLLQARVSVQFQSFLDKFCPNDAIFHFSVSTELTEGALSSACLLHTASGSMTSSTSSLRRRKLGEITEDAEENATGKDEPVPPVSQNHRRRESTNSKASEATAVPSQRDGDEASRKRSASQLSSDVPDKTAEKPLPSLPRSRDGPRTNGLPRKESLGEMSIAESRKSTQSARPNFREFDSMSMYRPKVRVGPRPSMDSNGRPRTAGSMSNNNKSRDSSLVASLPAGVRSSRKSAAPRNQSQPPPETQPQTPSRPPTKPPPVPALLVPPPPINLDPTPRNGSTSPKSVMSLPASVGGPSPEKQRLMRALQLRKQQQAKRAEEAENKKNGKTNGHVQGKPEEEKEEKKSPPKGCDKPEKLENADDDPARSPDQPLPEENKESFVEASQGETAAVEETKDDKKQVSPDPSTPDSAVGMVDGDSTVEENETGLNRDTNGTSENCAKEASATTEVPPSSDASQTANVDRPDPTPTEERASSREQSGISAQLTNGLHEGPDARPQDHIISTVVETHGERSDAGTPTPRAIPGITIRHEVMPQEEETPATKDAEDIPVPVEAVEDHQPEGAVSSAQQPKPDETPPSIVETVREEPKNTNNDDRTNLHHKPSLKDRRRGNVDPIRVPVHPESSDEDNLLSDDSFMEELGSARVQEARPVALPKPGANDNDGSSIGSRVVSSPTGGDSDVQALPAGRSASGSISSMVPRKVNVSSGISKRIKALEMFSSRESSPNPQLAPSAPTAPVNRSSSQFDKFRKRASLSQTSLPPASDLNSRPSPEAESPQRPPLRRESSSHTHKSRNMSSVSVTARIVRDQPPSSELDSSQPTQSTINLQPSELTVQHDNQEEPEVPSISTIAKSENPPLSTSNPQSPRNSMTGHLPRSESVPSRLSLSSASRYERTLSHSSGEHTPEELRDDKKESRTSRMIRRMSSITSSSRRSLKSALSPSLKEEEPAAQSPSKPEQRVDDLPPDPPQVVDIGEVNVQFPDTLLWKRRFMRVDEQGYLVLTPNTNEGAARNIVKRYHFSDLQPPSLPDQDREELPNSIVLDFLDGNTLQCACESRQGQSAVLQTLIDAHRTYNNPHAR